MKPIILVAGMSRSGSMWTYNITRRILKLSGWEVLPEQIPPNSMTIMPQLVKKDPGPGKILCFKTHNRIDPIVPAFKVISPYRDIRDAMFSFKRFMKCSFAEALGATQSQMDTADHYLRTARNNVLPLRYDQIIESPTQAISQISNFLELQISEEQMLEIANSMARDKVKSRLEQLKDIRVDDEGALESTELNAGYQTIKNVDGSYRVFDSSTGFQTDHVTIGGDGAWRTELDPAEQAAMMKLVTPWLDRYGFQH